MSFTKSSIAGLVAVCISITFLPPVAFCETNKELRDRVKEITVEVIGEKNQGSGVLIERSGDILTVLTSAHVLKKNSNYLIKTFDNQIHQAIGSSIRRSEKDIDLAVLKFRISGNILFYRIASELGIGDCYSLREGMKIYVAGFPLESKSRDLAFYQGEVSSNSFKKFQGGYSLVYSNDTFPGMSGGPVVNEDGQLVAIHGRGDKDEKSNPVSEDRKKTGFNLAIPINTFASVANSLGVSIDRKLYPTTTGPNNALTSEYYRGLGMHKYSLGDFRGAMADFDRAMAIEPSAENYFVRGMMRCTIGNDKANGVIDLERAAQIYKSRNDEKSYQAAIYLMKSYQSFPNSIIVGNFIVDRPSSEMSDITKKITVKVLGKKNDGSGTIVHKDGDIYTILTTASVITNNQVDRIVTPDNKTHQIISGSIRKAGGNLDLGVLKFRSSATYSIATIGEDTKFSKGMKLYIGGFPTNTQTITESAFVFRNGNLVKNDRSDYITYNNDTLAGMEGGPILNTRGELVAVHAKSTLDRANKDPIRMKQFNFGIPIKHFVTISSNLGVNLPTRPELLSRLELPTTAEGKAISAMKKWNLGDWQGAISELNEAIALDPSYAYAYYSKAVVYDSEGNWREAIANYQKAAILYQKQGNENMYLVVAYRLKTIENP